jgi:CshA-type fibril repeat protein
MFHAPTASVGQHRGGAGRTAAAAARRRAHVLLACAVLALLLVATPAASAAGLPGAAYDSGDGNQADGADLDWQGAYGAGRVKESADANDDCFVGGVKELAPDGWAFNSSAGGCTPGKSNLRVAYANPESAPATTFGHFAFFRNDTTGNTFLTFELNRSPANWTNSTGTTIPCRSDGDLLLSFEVGGSSMAASLYRWSGTGPAACPDGASGTFAGSGPIPSTRFQGAMNAAAAIANYVNPGAYGTSFPANAFGEAAVDIPAVLQSMGQSGCFGFLRMQVHSRSSSSISSAMIDYTTPVPVKIQSCAVTGTQYLDANGNGTRDAGEPGVAGVEVYADLDGDGTLDPGEPTGTSDESGFYRILDVAAGSFAVRVVPRPGWRCSQPDPCAYDRSIVTGGNSTGNDFGVVAPSSASGTAFEDLDADGVRDAGEPDLAGVELYADLDGDGVHDAGEPTGTSAADGTWSIEPIPAGTFTIRMLPRAGWTCSAPAVCGFERTFTSGSEATGLTFGSAAAATISGTVFEDLDGNGGARTGGDPVLAGWQVYLDADGDDLFDIGETQTLTDAAGNFAFSGLVPGARTVRVTAVAANWYCTRPGSTAALCEHTLTLVSGQSVPAADFGLSRTATVSGTKFDDADGDGIKDGTEGALAGFTFWIDLDDDNSLDADEPSAVSDAAGAWTISGVRAGTRTLRELPIGAYACTKPSPCTYVLTLASNALSAGHQFGNHVSRSVSGVVFRDGDADGLAREAGEPGVAGWLVYSDANNNSALDAGEPRSTSNSLGQYNLTGLANGGYRIRMVAQAGFTCSYPSACLNTGSIGSGQSDANVNFGIWGLATVSGTVYEDTDADGAAQEPGEVGLAGRVVYVDANNDGVRNGVEPSATTGATGAYAITGISPGAYVLRQVVLATWTCSRPNPCSFAGTVSAADVSGRDFASYTTATVSGHVFEDRDADGTDGGADTGLLGRTVFLDADDNGVQDVGDPSTTTNASGDYVFGAVAPGAYTVRQTPPLGWTRSAPAVAERVTVGSQSAITAAALGSYSGAQINGNAFEDTDFDGSPRQFGDAPIANRLVYLDLDESGTREADEPATLTTVAGAYAFSDVTPGTYVVRIVTPTAWACVYPAGCAHTVTVASRDVLFFTDFGAYVGATVSGTVFEDADGDGATREPGDAGVAGQRVYLDANDNSERDGAEPTQLTDADGNYAFTGVEAAAWTVRLELGDGWSCDSPAGCAHDLVLSSGATDGDRDFGIHRDGTVSGHLFTDRDNDGGPQAFGENDQPGRTVYVDENENETLDPGEPSATTGEDGDYALELPPGTYRIRQVLPAGWTCATPDPCEQTVTLTSREEDDGNGFSSWTVAAFSGVVFEDEAADGGFPLPGAPGLDGRTVYVDLDEDEQQGALEPAATTDSSGRYEIAGVAPGTYVVRTVPVDGWTCSSPGSCAQTLTLEAGEHAQDVDFGAWTTGTVAGVAFDDADASGIRESGESPLAGRTIYADLDDDGAQGSGEPFAVTDSGGAYQLVLDPGTYTLRQSAVVGWTCTVPVDCARGVTVVSRGTLTDHDFGSRTSLGAVGGTVFDDRGADGDRDATDPGREGVVVWVDLDDDGTIDEGEPQATTDADGGYLIAGAGPGTWTLRIAAGDSWACSAPSECSDTRTITSGQTLTGADFATWRPATIAGELYDDTDGDGQPREAGDAAVSDTVELRLAGDVVDSVMSSATDGTYEFTGVKPGTYTVTTGLDGRTCTRPAGCTRTITVVSGETGGDADFGGYRTASIAGTVSGPDGPLGGRTVYLDTNDDGTLDEGEPTALSFVDGTYAFTSLEPGSHSVRLDLPANDVCSAPAGCVRELALSSGEAATGADFSVYRVTALLGSWFEDRDGSGTIDATESGVAGSTVYLDLDLDGTRDADEPSTTTGDDGAYAFTGLAPGTYTVALDLGDGWICSVPGDCRHTRALGSGASATGLDFAAWRSAHIDGLVFNDLDGDGSRDEGEGVRGGVTVFLDRDDDGVLDDDEPSTVSTDDGRYAFAGLRPGAKVIRVVAPADWACTFDAPCRAAATVFSGGETTLASFGLHKLAGPKAEAKTSTGPHGAAQTQTLVAPPGGTVRLLDGTGEPTLRITIDGEGEYVLDPETGIVTFTPAAGFSGAARPAAYRMTDADGASADGTYTPTVEPPVAEEAPQAETPPPGGSPPAAVVSPPPAPRASPPAPAPRTCVSRRALTINWKAPRGVALRSITISLNGKRYKRLSGRARRAVISFKGRPRQTVRLQIRAVAAKRGARRLVAARTYRTCTPSIAHPPLATLKLRAARR